MLLGQSIGGAALGAASHGSSPVEGTLADLVDEVRLVTPDGEVVERPYTPARFEPPECELLVRVYPEGKVSRHLYELEIGDAVEMKGPVGLIRYGGDGPGTFSRGKSRRFEGVTHMAMLAGGTGITPMLQLCNHVLQDARDATQLRLVEANSCVKDIMMLRELRALAADSDGALKLTFTASRLTPAERAADPRETPLTHDIGAICAGVAASADEAGYLELNTQFEVTGLRDRFPARDMPYPVYFRMNSFGGI